MEPTLIVALAIAFAPSLIAIYREHFAWQAIILTNVLGLGFIVLLTPLGVFALLGALIWSFGPNTKRNARKREELVAHAMAKALTTLKSEPTK